MGRILLQGVGSSSRFLCRGPQDGFWKQKPPFSVLFRKSLIKKASETAPSSVGGQKGALLIGDTAQKASSRCSLPVSGSIAGRHTPESQSWLLQGPAWGATGTCKTSLARGAAWKECLGEEPLLWGSAEPLAGTCSKIGLPHTELVVNRGQGEPSEALCALKRVGGSLTLGVGRSGL